MTEDSPYLYLNNETVPQYTLYKFFSLYFQTFKIIL